jgi:REP element-mobilizing transposase RayT
MPRQLRIEYGGAKYHVMARGDRREAIFQDDEDRRGFLKTLGEACERTGWRVFAWVLMGNHYHLVLETPEANLVKGMQWFQTTWTVRYNRRHGLAGHLFGGRYKAVLVESDADASEKVWRPGGYIGAVIDYVHLNPVRARLVTPESQGGLLAYEWSSLAKAYAVEAGTRPPWMDVGLGLSFLGFSDRARGRRGYLEYLENRIRAEEAERCGAELPGGQTLQSTLSRGWYFGSQGFREEIFTRIAGTMKRRGRKRESYEGAAAQRSHGEAEAERLIEKGMRWMEMEFGEMVRRRGDRRPHLLAKLVRERTTVRNGWIAERLSMRSAANVSQQLYRLESALEGDKQLKRLWKRLSAECEE